MFKKNFLGQLRNGENLSTGQLLIMIIQLSIPAIMAQISSIIMQYIDASMVGHLGSAESASIGLVTSSTWLLGGLCSSISIGFTVQVAHCIGAKKEEKARNILRQGLVVAFAFSCVLLFFGVLLHKRLPVWLGGESDITGAASLYFLVYCLFLPVVQLNYIAGGMLQCSGNTKIPSMLHIFMCVLDVLFNAVLIFPTRSYMVWGHMFVLPGQDWE